MRSGLFFRDVLDVDFDEILILDESRLRIRDASGDALP